MRRPAYAGVDMIVLPCLTYVTLVWRGSNSVHENNFRNRILYMWLPAYAGDDLIVHRRLTFVSLVSRAYTPMRLFVRRVVNIVISDPGEAGVAYVSQDGHKRPTPA